jgi:hypothetical protein
MACRATRCRSCRLPRHLPLQRSSDQEDGVRVAATQAVTLIVGHNKFGQPVVVAGEMMHPDFGLYTAMKS